MTFEDVWRRARLEMPTVPPLLIRSWAQEGFARACDRHGWGFLRAESALQTLAARTVTPTATAGSQTLTSTLEFLAADAGRQVRFSGGPIYTIASVADASTALLDRPFSEDSLTATATILDAYVTLPADFGRFLVIIDRYNQRAIPFWMTEDQIAVADPARTNTDSGPRFLVAQKYSSATATLGQVRYEYHPYPTAARSYPYLYIRKATTLADTDALPGVFLQRADFLRSYCLWRGALWPGTADQKNPFYQPQMAATFKADWEAELQALTLSDDNEYPQQLLTVDWAKRLYGLSMSTTQLRQTDADLSDYY